MYPITADSPQWKTLTMEERAQSQQIPGDVLESMSTADVLESFLTLPSRIRILEYPGLHVGFSELRKQYNVVAALMERDDLAQIAIQRYLAFNVDENNGDDFDHQFRIDMTAILLSQDEVIRNLAAGQRKEVVSRALSIFNANTAMHNPNYWEMPTTTLICTVLYISAFPPFLQVCHDYPDIEAALLNGVFNEMPDRFETADLMTMAADFIREQ